MVILGIMLAMGGQLMAQEAVIGFQTEAQQGFEMRWQGNTYTSNEQGVVRIKWVAQGKQVFSFSPDMGDHYYEIQIEVTGGEQFFTWRLPTKGAWVLFDPISYEVRGSVMAGKKERVLPEPPIMTQAALQPLLPAKEEKAKDMVQVKQELVKPVVKQVERKVMPPVPLPQITRLFEKVGVDGIDMVFEVREQERRDTVVLFVPAPVVKVGQEPVVAELMQYRRNRIIGIEPKRRP